MAVVHTVAQIRIQSEKQTASSARRVHEHWSERYHYDSSSYPSALPPSAWSGLQRCFPLWREMSTFYYQELPKNLLVLMFFNLCEVHWSFDLGRLLSVWPPIHSACSQHKWYVLTTPSIWEVVWAWVNVVQSIKFSYTATDFGWINCISSCKTYFHSNFQT